MKRLLIANRGEIAIRIARAASALGIGTVAVYAADDAASLHLRHADRAVPLALSGPAAYLDRAGLLAAAASSGCDAVHPGYGFLSESADFARDCAAAGLTLVGPGAEALALFGDKARARAHAAACGVAVPRGTQGGAARDQVAALLAETGAVMLKAVAGGGGRGMRILRDAAALDETFARCASEAMAAFGDARLYAEELVEQARHVEVQVLGDGMAVSHLWERECSLQRRQQKLVEIAPAPALSAALREEMLAAALRMAAAVPGGYRGLGTFEFLVQQAAGRVLFIEANARLQVEHTVTEEVTGIDLVQAQLRVAAGASLAELGLTQAEIPRPRGAAVQLRLNAERVDAAGAMLPAIGTLTAYAPPSGPGIRVDASLYVGYPVSPRYDSLLAKLVVRGRDGRAAMQAAYRALCEFRIEGVATNIALLQALLREETVLAGAADTRFVEANAARLAKAAAHPRLFVENATATAPEAQEAAAPAGSIALAAPMDGMLLGFEVAEGAIVAAGQVVAIVEAMKLELAVRAEQAGRVTGLAATPAGLVRAGQALVFIEPGEAGPAATEPEAALDTIRPDLAESRAVHAATLDEARPEAVARRRRTGQMTARENIAALCEPGSFSEYGGLALAGQRLRRSLDELVALSPADGIVTGTGRVNPTAERFGQVVAMAYDYTVFAGTQGWMGHAKMDRMFALAASQRLPVVLFAEGGGGRPGESDHLGVGIECPTFRSFGQLSGLAPLVGVASGRCFAGNAALLGCCDVVIATERSNIGMGGPAMIEGGGLGVFKPEEVGPSGVQFANGVIDILVRDDAEAVAAARRYLSYFQGRQPDWRCAEQAALRGMVPANRRRAYDIRRILATLADSDSVLELRAGFGRAVLTALARIEGRPIGVLASDPTQLAGAIDADAADKASRFLQLCDAYGLPVLSLVDTPGFMVGPQAEERALVRHACRMFVTGANVSVPGFTIVLRRGYGLGALAMTGGSFHSAVASVAWPSGEFGGMGFEGAVRLAWRRELAALPDEAARQQLFEAKLAELYERGKAISAARFLEIDDVIDPADSRAWLARGLAGLAPPEPRRRAIDSW